MIKTIRNKSIVLLLALLVISIQCVVVSQARAGSIVAWGWNADGQSNVPSTDSDFTSVSAGGYHSLALKADGSIVAWGKNLSGQCIVPTPNSDFVAVSAGESHSLGLKADGTIVAWGWNVYGQGQAPSSNAGFAAVDAGWYHNLGLKADGSIVAWGRNNYGQCSVPAPNSDFIAVAAGGLHSLGLKADGSIVAWGYDGNGRLSVPAPNADFAAVSAGADHSLGLKEDGSIVAWGRNDYGQGQFPLDLPNTGFVAVAAGWYHNLGLKADGSIVAWGRNNWDQCELPVPNSGFVAISAGMYHNLALWEEVSNAPPVADADSNETVAVGDTVILNGNGSYDPDGNYPLSYSWQIVELPQNSTVQLTNPETMNPFFIPDLVGNYKIELVVTDSQNLESEPAYVVITVITIEQTLDEKLAETIQQIGVLDPNNLSSMGSIDSLINKVDATVAMIDEGSYQGALSKLWNDILKKTDGCVNTGKPDKNDWILTCEDQQKIYPLVVRAIELVGRLVQ